MDALKNIIQGHEMLKVSSICFLKPFKKNQIIMGLGIVSGSLSGATGTIWVLNRVRKS